MKKLLFLLAALCLAFALTGCGGSEKQAPAAAKAQVKLGMLRLTSSAPLFIAMDKGFFAEQNIENYFPIPMEYMPNKQTFMLKVHGESMINAGILNSDQVIVRKQNYADNGDIVIAMTEDNEATCKRFFKESDHYRLQPENDTMAPIILNSVSIVGKVIGLYRNMIR